MSEAKALREKNASEYEAEKLATSKILLEKGEEVSKMQRMLDESDERMSSAKKELEDERQLRVSLQMTMTQSKVQTEKLEGDMRQLLTEKQNEVTNYKT